MHRTGDIRGGWGRGHTGFTVSTEESLTGPRCHSMRKRVSTALSRAWATSSPLVMSVPHGDTCTWATGCGARAWRRHSFTHSVYQFLGQGCCSGALATIPPPFSSKSSRTYHFLVLSQDEVVVTEGHAENNRRHAFKTVDPLLPLRPLAANIKHPGRGRRTVSEATEIALPGHHTVQRGQRSL